MCVCGQLAVSEGTVRTPGPMFLVQQAGLVPRVRAGACPAVATVQGRHLVASTAAPGTVSHEASGGLRAETRHLLLQGLQGHIARREVTRA